MARIASMQPIYLQLRQQLRSDIIGGKTPPGERLGTENELMARFGVSRATVRKALAGLVDEGLVRRVPGAGTFVRKRQTRTSVPRARSGHVAIEGIDLHTTLSEATNELIRGCASAFESLGMSANVFLLDPDDEHAHGNVIFNQAIADHRIDGVISTVCVSRKHYLHLRELGIPVVLVFDWDSMDLPSVSNDNFLRFHLMTCLAIEAGWRVPALVKGPAPYRVDDVAGMDSPLGGFRAVEGFRQGIIQNGLPYYPEHVLSSNYRVEEAGDIATAIRMLAPTPDVLIVSGSEMAVALWDLLDRAVPVIATGVRQAREDICVIEIPFQEMGRRAAAMLSECIRDPARPPRQEFLNLDPEQVRERIFSYRQRPLQKARGRGKGSL